MSESFTIRRDGDKTLKFEGVELGHADGHSHTGPAQNRWSAVWLYCTDSGKYVWRHEYNTQWEGESDDHSATVYDTVADLLSGLEGNEGNEHHGYPRFGRLDQECLNEASLKDPAVAEAMVERI